MNVTSTIGRIAVVLATVSALTAFVGVAQAGTERPPGMSTAEYRALMLRSEALNHKYGLASRRVVSQGAAAAGRRALMLRSEALNLKYGLGKKKAAAAALAATGAILLPTGGQASSRIQTLRFFDQPVSITLTHADGTTVTHAPYPDAKPGDTLEVNSLDYVGNHVRHASRWAASTHLRCVFHAGPPTCESHLALRNSLLVFTGNPAKLTNGTGLYQGATGRVISSKRVGNDASDIIAQIQLYS